MTQRHITHLGYAGKKIADGGIFSGRTPAASPRLCAALGRGDAAMQQSPQSLHLDHPHQNRQCQRMNTAKRLGAICIDGIIIIG